MIIKDVLLNKKCLRHSMNKIQGKDHRIGIHEFSLVLMTKYISKTMNMMY